VNSIDKARWKIILFTMLMAGVSVYWWKNPYIAFLFGGISVMVNNGIWKKRVSNARKQRQS